MAADNCYVHCDTTFGVATSSQPSLPTGTEATVSVFPSQQAFSPCPARSVYKPVGLVSLSQSAFCFAAPSLQASSCPSSTAHFH